MSFKITDDASTLCVQWDGRPVFDYVYIPKGEKYEGLKPRFRLYSPGGDLLTLFKPHDHPWHYGLAMTLMWRGPRAFHYGRVLSPHGVEPKDPMGERYPWLAYLGQHDETLKSSTFAFCDDPRNPRYPNRWFIRTDPFAIMSCAFAFSE